MLILHGFRSFAVLHAVNVYFVNSIFVLTSSFSTNIYNLGVFLFPRINICDVFVAVLYCMFGRSAFIPSFSRKVI